MNHSTKTLKIGALAAALALGSSLLGAGSAVATTTAPPDSASCTGRTVSGTAPETIPFGGIVNEYATFYGDEWGQNISKEARTVGECPGPLPFPGTE